MSPRRTGRRRGLVPAAALAILAHLLALLALGWRVPRAPPLPPADALPPVELQLLRPEPNRPAISPPAGGSSRPRPTAARANPETTLPAAPNAAPPSPRVAEGPPDCEPEDLPLLTAAEKARCRNQIDADNARRLARSTDASAARQVAQAQRGPQTYRMGADKQAYYAAVAEAYDQQNHGPPMAGRHPEVHCSGIKPANSLKIGPLPCYVTPPQGFLTEESAIPRP
jgi:hypothetical protein